MDSSKDKARRLLNIVTCFAQSIWPSIDLILALYQLRIIRDSVHEPADSRPQFISNRLSGFLSVFAELHLTDSWAIVTPEIIQKKTLRGPAMHPVFTEKEEQLLAIAPSYPTGAQFRIEDEAAKDECLEIAKDYFRFSQSTPIDIISHALSKWDAPDLIAKKQFSEGAIDCLYAIGLISWNTGRALLAGLSAE